MEVEWLSQGLEQLGRCALVAAAKRDSHGEFTVVWKIDFPGQGDIAVLGRLKLPVHFEMAHKVLPTIAETDIADRATREAGAARHDQVNVFALGTDELDTAHFSPPAGVAGAEAGDVRSQQCIESQLPT